MTPADLVEIEQIRQLKARYFHRMDRKQWDEWEQVFCDDVLVDTTQEGSPLLRGRRAFREFLQPILADVLTVHHGHLSEITLTGPDTASGVWSMEDHLWWPASQGGRHLWGTGFYFEKYRKERDGEWRIAELVLRRTRVEVDGVQTFPPPQPPRTRADTDARRSAAPGSTDDPPTLPRPEATGRLAGMTNALREELLRLSAAERMELVEELWDSIADELERESFPLTAAQREELERRIREREADPESSPSWEEVRARLWARTRE